MASSRAKPISHAATREQLLKEEETIAKVADFVKLVQRLEKARTMCLQREAQEERCFEKSRKRQLAEMKEELHFANKQLIMVRRAALCHLLSFEHLQYQLELNHLGKSFYVERL